MLHEVLNRTILSDLAAGESPLTLNKARHDYRLQVDGRSRDVSWAHRAAKEGVRGAGRVRVVLETITQSGVKLTTPSAITRFIHRQAGSELSKASAMVADVATSHRRAEKALAAAGI